MKPNYVFSGVTASQTFNSTGGSISVGPYQGVSLSTTWGSNNAAGSVAFTASLATGNGDIAPSGFPPNTGNGNVVIYLEFTANPGVSFAKTPNAVFTANAFGGTTCYLYSLNGQGSTATWNQVIGPATPSGTTVTFPPANLQAPNTVDVGSTSTGNQVYLSLACK